MQSRDDANPDQMCLDYTPAYPLNSLSTIEKQVHQIHHYLLWKYTNLDIEPAFPNCPCFSVGLDRNSLWLIVLLIYSLYFIIFFHFFVPFFWPSRQRNLAGMWQEVLDKSARDRQTETGCTERLAAQTAQDLISLCDIYA